MITRAVDKLLKSQSEDTSTSQSMGHEHISNNSNNSNGLIHDMSLNP